MPLDKFKAHASLDQNGTASSVSPTLFSDHQKRSSVAVDDRSLRSISSTTKLVRPRHGSSARSDVTDRANHRNVLFAPIRIAVAFSLFTYAIYLWGPWNFPNRDNVNLAIFVISVNLAMVLGFRFGATLKSSASTLPRWADIHSSQASRNGDRLYIIVAFTAIITLIPRLVVAGQAYDLSIDGYLSKVQLGLTEAYQAYQLRFVSEPPGFWRTINHGLVATEFLSWLFVPLSILRWHRIPASLRLGVGLYILLWASGAPARGQNFGIFELAIHVGTFTLIAIMLRHRRSPFGFRTRKKLLIGVGLVVLGAIALTYFASVMESRVGEQYDVAVPLGDGLAYIEGERWSWKYVPEVFKPLIATLTLYIAHGYEGLAQAMEYPFDSTLGVGGSYFLLDNAKSLTGADMFQASYQYKLELGAGYDAHVFWHTSYLWIANDVSLVGVPVVLFIALAVVGAAWRDVVTRGNVFAALLMGAFAMFIAFISANHQLAARTSTLIGIPFILFLWMLSKSKSQDQL